MSLTQDVLAIQRLYPKLYVACHTTHGRSSEGTSSVTARECAVLSHLCLDPTLSAARLARHLGVGRSTLSDLVGRLVEQGFLESRQDPHDERKRRLTVTPDGIAAMSAISVLDGHRVGEVLARLTPHERLKAIEGLSLLAEAAMRRPIADIFAGAAPVENSESIRVSDSDGGVGRAIRRRSPHRTD